MPAGRLPGDRIVCSVRFKGTNSEEGQGVGGVCSGAKFVEVGSAVGVRIRLSVEDGSAAEVLKFPIVGQSVVVCVFNRAELPVERDTFAIAVVVVGDQTPVVGFWRGHHGKAFEISRPRSGVLDQSAKSPDVAIKSGVQFRDFEMVRPDVMPEVKLASGPVEGKVGGLGLRGLVAPVIGVGAGVGIEVEHMNKAADLRTDKHQAPQAIAARAQCSAVITETFVAQPVVRDERD